MHLAFEEPDWGGGATETDIVVAIVRVVVVAVRRAQVVVVVVEAPTTKHHFGLSPAKAALDCLSLQSCCCRYLFLLPTSDQAPELVDAQGGMLVLTDADALQISAQADIQSDFIQ